LVHRNGAPLIKGIAHERAKYFTGFDQIEISKESLRPSDLTGVEARIQKETDHHSDASKWSSNMNGGCHNSVTNWQGDLGQACVTI
jgi:hypothetical protein